MNARSVERLWMKLAEDGMMLGDEEGLNVLAKSVI